MSIDRSRTPDPARSALRAAVAAVDRAMTGARAPGAQAGDQASSLEAAWHKLVELLALGPEPDYRECPACGAVAMLEASVCGHCWTKLAPHGAKVSIGEIGQVRPEGQ